VVSHQYLAALAPSEMAWSCSKGGGQISCRKACTTWSHCAYTQDVTALNLLGTQWFDTVQVGTAWCNTAEMRSLRPVMLQHRGASTPMACNEDMMPVPEVFSQPSYSFTRTGSYPHTHCRFNTQCNAHVSQLQILINSKAACTKQGQTACKA
jgi:hypothetical protein